MHYDSSFSGIKFLVVVPINCKPATDYNALNKEKVICFLYSGNIFVDIYVKSHSHDFGVALYF